jgi:hypothetical protein
LRNTFRIHPKIRIRQIKYEGTILGGEYRQDMGTGEFIDPLYDIESNTICLYGTFYEETIVRTLVHEIVHWAMLRYLTKKEAYDSMINTINWKVSKAPKGIEEETAIFIARWIK